MCTYPNLVNFSAFMAIPIMKFHNFCKNCQILPVNCGQKQDFAGPKRCKIQRMVDVEVTARRAAHHSSSPSAAAASSLSRAPPAAKRDPAGDGGPWRRPARDPSQMACRQMLD